MLKYVLCQICLPEIVDNFRGKVLNPEDDEDGLKDGGERAEK